MPEFEEENVNTTQSESYTPSTDASKKPRTRRRSGGFKTEVASISNVKIGEVSAADALKEEKLSGKPTAFEPNDEHEEKPRRERKSREPRKSSEDNQPRGEREPRQKREPRTDANPQPSPETLAAIASVEAKINERRTKRDKDRRAKPGSSKREPRAAAKKPVAKKPEGSLLAAITGFFGKLFGNEPKSAPKKDRNRGEPNRQNRSGQRPQSRGGNRDGQNRGRSGKGGNRGGQNRGRGGKSPRRSERRNNDNAN